MECPFCHKRFTDPAEVGYIQQFDICLGCDKIRSEAEEEQAANALEEERQHYERMS